MFKKQEQDGDSGHALSASPPTKQFASQVVVLDPGATKSVGLGTYSISEPEPIFDLAVEPEILDMIGASLEQLPIPGKSKTMGLYQLHNYSDKPCKVTITRRGGIGPEQ